MKRSRIRRIPRIAAAALVALLVACDEDGISVPEGLAGQWRAEVAYGTPPNDRRIEDRLLLLPEGDYAWTTVTYGPGGREPDRLLDWTQVSGNWGVDDGRLALRALTGARWQGGEWFTLDFAGEWNRRHTIRLQGDLLIVEELPYRGDARAPAPRTYVFERIPTTEPVPQPSTGAP